MIHWGSLLIVQLVSIGATLAVTTLVSVAVLGLSAPESHHAAATPGRHAGTLAHLPARSGRLLGATCLVLAAAIVVFGLWQIIAR
jgi:hypothetical protein